MTRKTVFLTRSRNGARPRRSGLGAVDPSPGSNLAQTDAHDRAFAVKQAVFPGDDHVRSQSQSSSTTARLHARGRPDRARTDRLGRRRVCGRLDRRSLG
jgi:hypothetical protein